MSENVPHRNCRMYSTRNGDVNFIASNAVSPSVGGTVNVTCITANRGGLSDRVCVGMESELLGTGMIGLPFCGTWNSAAHLLCYDATIISPMYHVHTVFE